MQRTPAVPATEPAAVDHLVINIFQAIEESLRIALRSARQSDRADRAVGRAEEIERKQQRRTR